MLLVEMLVGIGGLRIALGGTSRVLAPLGWWRGRLVRPDVWQGRILHGIGAGEVGMGRGRRWDVGGDATVAALLATLLVDVAGGCRLWRADLFVGWRHLNRNIGRS